MDHGYGSRYYWGMFETGPFLLGDVQMIQLTPKINIMAWVPRKINNPASSVAPKRLEINILTRHKLPDPPPPPQNQMVVLLILL